MVSEAIKPANPVFHRSSVLAGGCYLVLLSLVVLSRIVYPFDIGNEAAVWKAAEIAAHGSNPYAFARIAPFIAAPYGYLYYLMIGFGQSIFGPQFWFGRSLAVLGSLVCCWAIYRIVRGHSSRRSLALIAALAFLTLTPVQWWIAYQRSDSIALALSSLAIVAALSPTWKKSYVAILWGISLLIAAFFTKQTFFLASLYIACELWRSHRPRQGFTLILFMALLCLAAMLLLNATSGGGYVEQHFVMTRHAPVSYEQAFRMLIGIMKDPGSLVFTIALCVSFLPEIKRALKNRISTGIWSDSLSGTSLLLLYFGAALGLAFVTSARRGASINYYMEACFAGAILLGFGLSRVDGESRKGVWVPQIVFWALLLSGGAFAVRMARGEYFRWRSLPYFQEVVETTRRYTNEGDVCFSVYPELALRAGRQYHFPDWLQYIDGRSPDLTAMFFQQLRSGAYAAIIWHDAGLSALAPGYRLVPMTHPLPERVYSVFLFVRQESVVRQVTPTRTRERDDTSGLRR